jgi:uncharacterized protein
MRDERQEISAPSRPSVLPQSVGSRPMVRGGFGRASPKLPGVGAFDDLATRRTVVVTTYKRDGSVVPTAVNVIVRGDHAYFRTWSTSGKAKRLRRDTRVLIAPSTARGRPTGPAIPATARMLGADEDGPIRQALTKKYPVLQGRLVPLAHRLRHYNTVHYELTAS